MNRERGNGELCVTGLYGRLPFIGSPACIIPGKALPPLGGDVLHRRSGAA
ncbi:hypothetical protein J2Z22_001427 [Paenibacillus forsythiae]|uniref:Uncharacterized protein n=1 Tax=Paenibacillus forsythiae TaxID=365616 RepID=A0ABU3H506_9BACL|nr:hypothetical protein [Paenibacillus forsythiae]MDT3425907.1 hypothetical protein [Paenibacillus forsythiae]